MKKIFLLIALTLLAISTATALEPLKVAIFKTGGAANVQVVLNDYTGGTATAVYTGPSVSLTPNSSGIIVINIANNTAATDWADITAGQVNSYYVLDVIVGGTLYAQYRLDQQIINQSQGGVLDSDGNLTPPEDGGGSIGSDDARWSDLFVGSNTIHVGPAGGAPLTELAISYNAGTAYLNVDNNNSLSLSPTLLNFNNNLFRVDANTLDYSSGRFRVDATRLDYRSGTFRVDDNGLDYKSGRLRVYDTDFSYKNYFTIDGNNGNTTLNGNTSVSGSKTFTVGSGATILGGTLVVTGATTLTDLSGTGTRNVQVDNTGKLVAGGGTVTTNSSLIGDGSGTPLGINLANANTWTGNQTFNGTATNIGGDLVLTSGTGTISNILSSVLYIDDNLRLTPTSDIIMEDAFAIIVNHTSAVRIADDFAVGATGGAGDVFNVALATGNTTVGGDVTISNLSSGGTRNLQVDADGKLVAGGGTVTTNATINGDGAGTALGINLANANTWTGAQTLPTTSAQGNALISSINAGNTTIDAARVAGGGGGGGTLAYTEVTANTTLNTDNRVVFITSPGGPFVITLPASPSTGQLLYFYSESPTSTINPNLKVFRDNGTDYGTSLFSDFTAGTNLTLFYNGTKWLPIGRR